MKAVGIRELKAQLSRYLRDVAGGETVLVTDRGRVIAELRAPGANPGAPESDLERRLRVLAARIPLTMGRHRPGFVYRESPLPPAPPGTALRLINEERDEHDRLR
jgi:antitoxin (DNA-binding transcriptional repressor) of toxin-antitoxin stability system